MKKLTTEPIAHHTRKGYRQGCRETCCRKAHTELVLYYRNARPLRYRPEMVPVDEARAHVLGLLAQQTEFERLPVTVIADRAGVNRATIVRLISDNPKLAIKTIEADKAARIRRVKFEPVTRNACGTKRRLDALFWQGWSIRRIASKIGVPYAVLIVVFEGRSLRVPVKLHEQVAEFYASYWLTLAGLSRAQLQNQRRTAQIRLRYPPGAWDGAEINDPNVEPDQKVQWYI